MNQPFMIHFSKGPTALGIKVWDQEMLLEAIQELGLETKRAVIVLVGGAGGLDDFDLNLLDPLFTEAIAPLAEEIGAAVIDGGTHSGIMALIGRARSGEGYSFPLIGVAVEERVTWPGWSGARTCPQKSEQAPLDDHHTHFLMVPGSEWGEESAWIFRVADILAGPFPLVTVLINGGEIAFRDVENSLLHHRPVIVVAGSGRTADVLANWILDPTAHPSEALVSSSGLLTVVQMENGSLELKDKLKSTLAIGRK